jgi:hypothetical protein
MWTSTSINNWINLWDDIDGIPGTSLNKVLFCYILIFSLASVCVCGFTFENKFQQSLNVQAWMVLFGYCSKLIISMAIKWCPMIGKRSLINLCTVENICSRSFIFTFVCYQKHNFWYLLTYSFTFISWIDNFCSPLFGSGDSCEDFWLFVQPFLFLFSDRFPQWVVNPENYSLTN